MFNSCNYYTKEFCLKFGENPIEVIRWKYCCLVIISILWERKTAVEIAAFCVSTFSWLISFTVKSAPFWISNYFLRECSYSLCDFFLQKKTKQNKKPRTSPCATYLQPHSSRRQVRAAAKRNRLIAQEVVPPLQWKLPPAVHSCWNLFFKSPIHLPAMESVIATAIT